MDYLIPHASSWTVVSSPTGKQIFCTIGIGYQTDIHFELDVDVVLDFIARLGIASIHAREIREYGKEEGN